MIMATAGASAFVLVLIVIIITINDLIDCCLNRLSGRSYAADHSRRTALRISYDEDMLDLCLVGKRIDLRTLFIGKWNSKLVHHFFVGLLSNRWNEIVARNLESLVCLNRASSSGSVRLAKFHHSTCERLVLQLDWIGQEAEGDPFRHCQFIFLTVCRHFIFSTSVHHSHVLHTWNSQCCPCAVHSGISSTTDNYIGTEADRLAVVSILTKELQCADHCIRTSLIIKLQLILRLTAHCIEHIIEPSRLKGGNSFFLKLCTEFEIHSMPCDVFYIRLYGFLCDSEFRNHVSYDSTCILLSFEDCDLESGTGQEECCGQTGRTGTYHRRLDICRRIQRLELAVEFLRTLLHCGFLHVTDLHCTFIIHSGTVELALMVTDVACDVRQGVILINQFQSLGIASITCQCDVVRNVLMNRACFNAWCCEAIEQFQSLVIPGLVSASECLLLIFHGSSNICKMLNLLHIDLVHLPCMAFILKYVDHRSHPGISARLEHVSSHGYRSDSGIEDILNRECICTA